MENQWPSGINEVMPFAMLLHAKVASGIRTKHVKNCVTIILVTLVVGQQWSINSGVCAACPEVKCHYPHCIITVIEM